MIQKIVGIIGLVLLIGGNILTLKEKTRKKYSYPLFLFGGIGLLIYSIYIKDTIFIVLQGIFIIVTLYEIIITKNKS
jgi:lipid-A-disaccharide synthase-like uncharacterized protein